MDKKDLKQLSLEFAKQFVLLGQVGTLEGGDGTPARICAVCLARNAADSKQAEYGCQPDEDALLVDWIPAGMTYDRSDPNSWPEEAGVDPALIPPRATWAVFPRRFMGVPVYYKRGHMAFAG